MPTGEGPRRGMGPDRSPIDPTIVERPEDSSSSRGYEARVASLEGVGRLERLITDQGMGAILLVEGVEGLGGEAGSPVVIKLLKTAQLEDREAANRFRRELKAHWRLSQELEVPRLVPCLGFEEDHDPARVFGVFPFYPGGTLEDFMATGGGVRQGLRVLVDAVEGLQSLHGHGYVHRDFCPPNIFVHREAGVVRGVLGDLGVGHFLRPNTILEADDLEEERGLRAGHRGYIDPQTRSERSSDLFAVGASLYFLLVGRHPPEVEKGQSLGVPSLSDCRSEVTLRLHSAASALVERLTTPDLAERLPSASEARVGIAALVDKAGKTPTPGARRSARSSSSVRRRNGRFLVAAGLLALTTAVVWFLLAGGSWLPDAVGDERPTVGSGSAPGEEAGQEEVAEGEGPVGEGETRIEDGEPGADAPVAGRVPEAALAAVSSLLRNGQFGPAEMRLRELLREHPGDPDAVALLALLASREGAEVGEDSIALLESSLRRFPERGDLRLVLSRLLAGHGRIDEAIGILTDAPENVSHRREISALRVTLTGEGTQSQ